MSWTDERVEQLKKMWLDGLSASQIANELGHGVSRNAVIGKVHRLGLSGRAKSPAPAAAAAAAPARPQRKDEPVRPAPAPITHGALALAMDTRPAPAPAPRVIHDDVVIPISERVTIMDLRESMCRWPLGDPTNPDFRYCGAKMQIGAGPYCQAHARIAYQPVQDRRREREREKRAARG
ncbi:GcrA cell cycle regulator [Rhodoblastus acidophilus]|uniref:GcrA family cell cycle regulator n=1 Tax=Rhodoblastus acidophilus TaxID=1074 RepID=UPI0022253FA3|nr:GcrA family cell cycle regulator [Rhodoblastus acidophilus]MCW2282722.1 GcrA cell cycle regulator [Rhodoblastus acidophilus]MCW2331583.1 GcrA cell cycle regulator [Rhodoblastus acidophilus]